MNLYPNPVDGVLNVSMDLNTEEDLVYTVLDMQGRVIKQVRASLAQGRNILEIDTQDMQQGQYIFLVNSTEGVMTKRFIVQH
ncbi:MAG: T9SS type A sorting domain-containing protein [Bacteroidetes bacterium]|nr:T9SS type A sorting domain-containing protein [Bacteroidota bacterium]